MLLTLVAKGYFDEITQKFQISGHTYLSSDRDFALIKKVKRRSQPLIPKDLMEITGSACHKTPFIIIPRQMFTTGKLLPKTS